MSVEQAQHNAIFFLALYCAWYLFCWLFWFDFPALPGVKRYQILLGLFRARRRRKTYKVCLQHAVYLRLGQLGDLVPRDRCQICVHNRFERTSK